MIGGIYLRDVITGLSLTCVIGVEWLAYMIAGVSFNSTDGGVELLWCHWHGAVSTV